MGIVHTGFIDRGITAHPRALGVVIDRVVVITVHIDILAIAVQPIRKRLDGGILLNSVIRNYFAYSIRYRHICEPTLDKRRVDDLQFAAAVYVGRRNTICAECNKIDQMSLDQRHIDTCHFAVVIRIAEQSFGRFRGNAEHT